MQFPKTTCTLHAVLMKLHVVFQAAQKLHIKNVLMFDHSPVKNIQSLDLVSTKKK
jgi:hypothetical protein